MRAVFPPLWLGLLCCSCLAQQAVSAAPACERADLLIENARVYTVDAARSWAQAVAVKDDKVIYVGLDAGAVVCKGQATKVVDLEGQMLLPGFVDGHNHAYLMSESLFWLSLNSYSTVKDRQQALTQYRRTHSDIRQLRAVGWDDIEKDAAAAGVTPRLLLDQAVDDIPVAVISNDHHQILANSKALQLAGIGRDTPDPQGGYFSRDSQTGEPSGVLHEFAAQNLVIRALPQPDFTVDEYKQTLLAWQKVANADGLTSVFVPIHYPTESLLQAFKALDQEGKLTLRYDLALWANENRGVEQVPELVALRAKYRGKSFRIDSVKLFSDGVGASKLVWDQRVLEQTVAAFDKVGFRIYVHAIGNAEFYPSSNVLDAFAYAQKMNGRRDSRHSITHLDWTRHEEIRRFQELGVVVVPQPVWFGKNWYADAPQDKRVDLNMLESYFKAGVPVVSSSDFPSSDTFRLDMYPLAGIEVGMTRLDPITTTAADPGSAAWPRERATLPEMIASYTINGAYLTFSEHETGSIEVGKQADFVVLDRDLFRIPVTSISDVKVTATYYEGKEVFHIRK